MSKLFLHNNTRHFFITFFLLLPYFLLLFLGCVNQNSSRKTSFHPLPELTFIQTEKDYNGNSYSICNDFVVIANPPEKRKKLQDLIQAYNKKTLSQKHLNQQFGYIRCFYRESTTMPRDYKESHDGYFKIDRWENHGNDLLVIVKWGAYGKELTYEFP
jgi:hypothetical protein